MNCSKPTSGSIQLPETPIGWANSRYQLSRSEERRVGKECRHPKSTEQAEDGIRDTSVTGVQTCALPIFDQALEAARTFKPMSQEEVAALLARTAGAAASGKYELFKTDVRFDSTARNPHWLG